MVLLTLKFLLVHVLGDFVLQPSRWVIDKQNKLLRSPYLYIHLLVHFLLLLMVLGDPKRYWFGIMVTIFSHFAIDLAKLLLRTRVNKRLLFFGDQLAHFLVILIVVNYYNLFKLKVEFFNNPGVLLLIISIVFLTEVSSIFMKVLLSRWTVEGGLSENSLDNAGKYIGMLERLLIFFFVVLGYWQSIGFLLAAKSVFRFGDLSKAKDRKLTEYILIGTLVSFGMAIIIGISYKYLLKMIS
ncbi:MAG: DUF3307 domain-containing protein [Bacteroidota bacterium]